MQKDRLIRYIYGGTTLVQDSKKSMLFVAGPGWMTLMSIVPGVLNGGWSKCLLLTMIGFFLMSCIAVWLFSSKSPTIERMLISQLLICANWIFQLCSWITLFLVSGAGWSFGFLVLYIPVVLVPLVSGFFELKNLAKEGALPKVEGPAWSIGLIGGFSGYAGIRLARSLGEMSQKTVGIIMCIGSTIIVSFLSLGLLNIQRLYLLHKYRKNGFLPQDLSVLEYLQNQ